MTIGWDRNKDLQLCGVWKIPVSSPRSGEANAQLRLLSYSVYQPPCSAFRHSWIPLHCSTMVRPAPVYCRSLAACTALRQRPNTSVFLVTIFSPAHAAENRSNARWRPCWEDAVSTKLSAKNKRLILPLPSVTLTSSRLLPCIQFIDCEQEWWQHTHPYRSPTPMANGCRLTLPTQKRTFEQECNELKTSNRRPSTLHWGFSRAIVMLKAIRGKHTFLKTSCEVIHREPPCFHPWCSRNTRSVSFARTCTNENGDGLRSRRPRRKRRWPASQLARLITSNGACEPSVCLHLVTVPARGWRSYLLFISKWQARRASG